MDDPMTMTNDEAQEWLLGLLNATPPPRDAGRFGAAIRAIRAKAIADAKEWGLAATSEPTLAALLAEIGRSAIGLADDWMGDPDHGFILDRLVAPIEKWRTEYARLHERTASQEGEPNA